MRTNLIYTAKRLNKMSNTTITDGLVEFVNMAKNPVPFDPISYVDRTKNWEEITIPLNKLRVKDIKTNSVTSGEGKNKRTLTERYAIVTIDSDDPKISGKYWKIYNRIIAGERSRSSPAFSQLCNLLTERTSMTTNKIKKLVTPQKSHKDFNNKWVYITETGAAIDLLNRSLENFKGEQVLRINPEVNKIEAIVSQLYAPVTNKEVLTLLQAEIGDFDVAREFHDDRRSLFQVIPDKFAGMSDSEDYGLFVENSSTGFNNVGMGMFVITSVCTNGMMFTSSAYGHIEQLRRKHIGDKTEIIKLIQDQCALMSGRIEETFLKIERAKTLPLRGEEYNHQDLIDNLLTPLAEAENLSKKTVKKVDELLQEKYQHDSIWDFVSALTEAAQDAPPHSQQRIEKVAGNVLELLVQAAPAV